MIKLCPNCGTERSLSEIYCTHILNGAPCNWNLTLVRVSQSRLPEAPRAQEISPRCRNGHSTSPEDLICLTCGAELDTGESSILGEETQAPGDEIPSESIEGWRLGERLTAGGKVSERFRVVRENDSRSAVLTLYAVGSEPEPSVYDVLRKLPRDHVPELYELGRWNDRAFEVAEHIAGGCLADLASGPAATQLLRQIAAEIGSALNSFAEFGLRHRDIRPQNITIRVAEPLDLVVTGFGSAQLSDLDLDVVSPLETSVYMAPEAVAGGVSAASDWWSLGIILLEKATGGTCFHGIKKEPFLIHAISNGVDIPPGLDQDVTRLLRGLLVQDHRKRWRWPEVKAWLSGQDVPLPVAEAASDDTTSPGSSTTTLGGRAFRQAKRYALAAAEPENWMEAREQFVRGALAAWIDDLGPEGPLQSAVRQISHLSGLSDDFRMALVLKAMHPAMPLVVRGDIVTPGWLLDHPDEGFELISGPAPEYLQRSDSEPWLHRLKIRAQTVRSRAKQLEIALVEEELRVHLLSSSRARLSALWEERRARFPDTEHPGLISILERRQTAEEDLILLLSAEIAQFKGAEEIVVAAEAVAVAAGMGSLDRTVLANLLGKSRRELHAMIDERTQGFARCGIVQVDEWADLHRLERRIPIERAIVLLSVDRDKWLAPRHQAYISTLLDFFAKKISGATLRGPLARMLIGKTTPRVDVMEFDSERKPASAIMQQLLSRSDLALSIDPSAFAKNDSLDRRVRAVYGHSVLYKRDTGIDGLYVGFPFLLMRDSRGTTRTKIAPVLLWPVKIDPEVGNRGHVSIAFDRDRQDVRLNPAFEGLIGIEAARRWQEAADDLLGRASLSPNDVMDAFGTFARVRSRKLEGLPGPDVKVSMGQPELACSAVVFHLAYMGQAIVHDLSLLRNAVPNGTGLETALRLREQSLPAPREQVHEIDRFFTAASDPSQEDAVFEARREPGLLIEGPPGTGKSQTIVHMVADAIGRKKSVLVVCQKQPALDVVKKRLEAEGLSDRIVMVSDVNKDRESIVRSIREQVEEILGSPPVAAPRWLRDRTNLSARIEGLEKELHENHYAMHCLDEHSGLSYRALLAELIRLDEAAPTKAISVPPLRQKLGSLNPSEVIEIQEICGPLSRLWLASEFEGSPLASLEPIGSDPASLEILESNFKSFHAKERARLVAIEKTPQALGIDDPHPLGAWMAEHADAFNSLDPKSRIFLARWLPILRKAGQAQSRAHQLASDMDGLVKSLSEIGQKHELNKIANSLADKELLQAEQEVSIAIRQRGFFSIFNPAWWMRRRKLKLFLQSQGLDASDTTAASFVSAAQQERKLRPIRKVLRALLGELGLQDRVDTDAAAPQLSDLATEISAELRRLQDLANAVERFPDTEKLCAVVGKADQGAFASFRTSVEQALIRRAATAESLQAVSELEGLFKSGWLMDRAAAIRADKSNESELDAIEAKLATLSAYVQFRLRTSRIPDQAMATFQLLRAKAEELKALPVETLESEVKRTIGREARLAWKARIENEHPALLLEQSEIDSRVESLGEADKQKRRANRSLLSQGVDRSRLGTSREWENVTRLTGQRARRLREFMELGTPIGLMELRPIWLMNPDVASRVLPLKSGMFDIVIYDEASQMPVEHALPTLFRGRVVVVSGDEKQMPPTAFFASKVENDEAALFDGEEPEEDATEQERDEHVEVWNRREIKDCPDLLQLARGVLPRTTLQIHYRSKYRELIDFSNAAFYASRLNVPVRHPVEEVRKVKPIELIDVGGVYSDQSNSSEAKRVGEIVRDIWASSRVPPTVGVVTFNRKQADLIEDVLEEMAESDGRFRSSLSRERERLDDGEDVGFFVKNVENVQGDERDVIIFSSTFGRDQAGTFRRTFGVLGQIGGERRLNVAVTRARQKVVMVTSMPISEISDMLSVKRPASTPRDYLQGYFEYARAISAGDLEAGAALLTRMMPDRAGKATKLRAGVDEFSASVLDYISEMGWIAIPANEPGAFGIDFAIKDPTTGLFGIGIECDAPLDPVLASARAREIWRPSVLRLTIPNLHRVSSREWLSAPKRERGRLKSAIESAIGRAAR